MEAALPSSLPASPEVFSSSSPSPPPPPPSYLICDLSLADLPPPPPLTMWQDMDSRRYLCCYDPPSPEVKSEYDPQLPPGFFSTADIVLSSPLPPPVPPPPRPPLLPPPTPSTRRPSEDLSQPHKAATFNAEMDHPESMMESGDYEEEAFETSSTISLVSSSTLTGTYFQTPDSATSPLPPHNLHMSPVSTDLVTTSSQLNNDSLTPPSDISSIPSLFSVCQEYNIETRASDVVSQASYIKDASCNVPVSSGVPIPSFATDSKLEQCESLTLIPDMFKRKESFKSESDSSVRSVVSYTTNDTAGPAAMSSPLSTDVPSLPSLPTDPDSASSGLGSFTTDTWSLSTEMDSQLGGESVARTKISGSSPSDTAYATTDSGTVSPAFSYFCTIKSAPADCLTPHSRSPTLTPLAVPRKPLQTAGRTSGPPEPLEAADGEVISAPLKPLQAGDEGTSAQRKLTNLAGLSNDGLSPSHISNQRSKRHSSPAINTDVYLSSSPHVNEHYTNQTEASSEFVSPIRHTGNPGENSSSTEILFDGIATSPNNSYVSERADNGERIENYKMPAIPVSVSNGSFFEQIAEVKSTVVMEVGKEEEEKTRTTDESGKRYSVSEKEDKVYVGEYHEETAIYTNECTEEVYSEVVKDMNGNISYLGSKNGGEAQLENRELRGNASDTLKEIETQNMEAFYTDTLDPTGGTFGVQGYENISLEELRPLVSPVSPSTCSHVNGYVCSTLSNIHPNDTSQNLALCSEPSLSSCNERDSLFQFSGASSGLEHCSLVPQTFKLQTAAQALGPSKDAIERLDAVVVTMENLSADLPVSSTLRVPEVLPLEPQQCIDLRMTDQPLTQEPEICKKLVTGEHQSQAKNNEELKTAVCHHTFPSSHEVLPHPTPLSSTPLSHSSISTASLLHVGGRASHDEPSMCVPTLCPPPATTLIHPTYSASLSFWNVSHTGPESLRSSCSHDSHANSFALVKNTTEFSSEEGEHFRSCQTDFHDSLSTVCVRHSPSMHSSSQIGSLLDGQPSSSPAPRPRTPPTPPPRSCHNTPRISQAPPLPPPRQYLLVPINQSLGALPQPSPPPAPPRSTSVHRASPPPPPRPFYPHLPSPVQEWNKGPPLPPPPTLSIHTTPLQPALTPVPEESSTPQSPAPTRILQLDSPISDGAPSTLVPLTDSLFHKKLPANPFSSPSCNDNDPPALPPPPEDEQDEEELASLSPPPPLPPPLSPPSPPLESEDEMALPLPPPPPPPPDVLLSPSLFSPLQSKAEYSTPLCLIQMPTFPDLCVANSHTNLTSAPSSDLDPPPRAVDDIAILPPSTKHPNVTASQKSPMPNSQAVDASAAPSPPPVPSVPHASSSSMQEPSSAPPLGPNTGKATKPSLITTSPYGKMVVVRSDLPLPSPEEEVRTAFTAAKDWGFLTQDEDTLSVYTQLRPVIQQGPQCGLVALSMASQVFPQTVEVEELLAAGRAEGVTRHGEMFSATKLARLAERALPGLHAEVRRDVLSSPATLLQLLLQGDLVLVPYDAERNHQPGLKGGHKAHWGVVCGCLVQSRALTFPTTPAKLDSHVDQLWHVRPRSRAGRSRSVTPCTPTLPASSRMGQRSLRTPDGASGEERTPFSVKSSRVNTPMLTDLQNDEEVKLVPLWRQGKSRKIVAAPLDQLCESNDQLMSYPPPSTPHEEEYVVESVQDGLAGQVVVLHKTKVALSDLVGLLQEK